MPWRALAGIAVMSLLVSTALAQQNRTIRIDIPARVSVSQDRVTLGDVASLSTTDLGILKAFMSIPLGAAPRPGRPVWLDREDIERWITARAATIPGATLFKLDWRGAAEVRVDQPAQQFEGDQVELAARGALLEWLQNRRARAEVQAVSSPRDFLLPEGPVTLRVRPLSSDLMPTKRMPVWVDVWVDGRFARSTTVTFEVAAWADASVASRDLERGMPLDGKARSASFVQQSVDLTTLRSAPIALASADTNQALDTQRLKRPMRAGDVLMPSNTERSPSVERGQSAQMQSGNGGVSISTRVEVLQNGSPGDLVRVKVAGAKGEVTARVTGHGSLELQP